MVGYASLFTDEPDEIEQHKEAPYRLLLVDDEINVTNALRRVFRHENYEIVTVDRADKALTILDETPCHLIISDYMMPGMDGATLLRHVKDKYPDTIRIMLTGHADTNAVMGAIKEGAVYKFILKPWNDDDLRVSVALALEQYELQRKNRKLQNQADAQSKEISSLAKLAVTNRSQLAIMLHKRGLLNEAQVQELYKQQQIRKKPILDLILAQDWIDENAIRQILVKDMLFEEVSLNEINIDPDVFDIIPQTLCRRQNVLPVSNINRRLTLVMADPMDMGLIDDLRFSTGIEIQPVTARRDDIQAKLDEIFGEQATFEDLETLVSSDDPYEGIEVVIDDDDEVSLEQLLKETDEPPSIRLVNVIILEAIRLGASDIHIHPKTKNVSVRYRIDGVLVDKIFIPSNLHTSIVARIKVMSELDITERRRPQDGRITVKTSMRIIDLRISTLPTINGEKVVMRILDRNSSVLSLYDLGMDNTTFNKIDTVIHKPQGIILATGPTGSGKTTTLYSMLQHDASPEKNYVTIEDPVEYYLDIAGQVMIKEKIGLDFSTVLRAILRQDPDVILLGEIRDHETAEVAFHAALTGHVVYSTLHTNSSLATIARLFDLGLKPYVIASALEAVIAQRLVRKNCESCTENHDPDPNLVAKLGRLFDNSSIQYKRGKGCNVCNQTGYQGRVALYETLIPSAALRHLISIGASLLEINQQAEKDGLVTLIQDAHEKAIQGLISVEEVFRVLGPQVGET